MADEKQRPELSTVRPRADASGEWLDEVALHRALRRLVGRWIRTASVALVGAGGGAGLASLALSDAEQPAVSVEAEAERSTEVGEQVSCQVSAQTEATCARAVHDARTAIDYFAALADACELPRDARPSR